MTKTVAIFERSAPEGWRAGQVFERITGFVNERGGQIITRPNPETLMITRAPSIFRSPLLPRATHAVTVTVEDVDGIVVVSAVGDGDGWVVRALEAFLA